MSTTLAVATPVEVVPRDFAEWKDRGDALFKKSRKLRAAHESTQWEIGDWLLEGEEKFHQIAYEEASQLTGRTVETLRNMVFVMRRFKELRASLRSDARLGWSHCKEIARIPDAVEREKCLVEVSDGLERSVRDVRTLVDAKLRQLESKKSRPTTKPVGHELLPLPVLVTRDDALLIKAIARIEQQRPDEWLAPIVAEYMNRHRRGLEVRIEKAKARKRR